MALAVRRHLFLWCCPSGRVICGYQQQFEERPTLSLLRGDDRQAINPRPPCASRPLRKRVQRLWLQMRIAPQHLSVLVTRDKRHLFNREPGLEQAAGAFVAQVVKVQFFNSQRATAASERCADRPTVVRKNAALRWAEMQCLLRQDTPAVVPAGAE